MPFARRNRRPSPRIDEAGELSPTTTASPVAASSVTTLMIRNIPTRYTSSTLIEAFAEKDFGESFDFFYLPMDFRTKKNVGYAFVNFINPQSAKKFVSSFQGIQLKASTSLKCLDIIPSRRQGFLSNISVFGASELLSSNNPNASFKPLVLQDQHMVPLTDTLYDQLLNNAGDSSARA